MKVPYSWLREYCDSKLEPDQLAERLALTGTEVERVIHFGPPTENGNLKLFRVGNVLKVEDHPDADRLRVCEVDLGESESRTIVCGAPNISEGQKVPIALPGAVLQDGQKIKQAELRGVRSDGMILSDVELGLGQSAEGIMVLPDDFDVGAELSEYFQLADDVFELEVTPNRPDCLSVYGVAHEVHAICDAPLENSPARDDVEPTAGGDISDLVAVEVDVPDLCPRFTARVFVDVNVKQSPMWLKARLIAIGQRPINNVVDITNYVMFLLGQPMHAYDLDKIGEQKLVVKMAREGETLTTLDGETRAFDSDAVLISDGNGVCGIAGIMGGTDSEVSESTTRVLMEAANWNGPNILKTSSKLQLRSEASTRFEKMLHPNMPLDAQRVAARLMIEICDAKIVPGQLDVTGDLPEKKSVSLRGSKLEGLLGETIDLSDAAKILERLGFGTDTADGAIEVEIPDSRYFDVEREADLIEEVARIHGLDQLPITLPSHEEAVGGLSRDQSLKRMVEDCMRYMGFSEAICWSFISSDFTEKLRLPAEDERRSVLQIENPLSEDQSVMRTTLLPGLLDVAYRNIKARRDHVRIFESGRVFIGRGQEELADERHHMAALMVGSSRFDSWRTEQKKPDFYMAKGTLQALLGELGVEWRLADGGPAFLHPGRAAEVLSHGHECGWIGEIHPLVASAWSIEENPVAFELDLGKILGQIPESRMYEDVVMYPSVYQDLAVVVDDAVESQTVIETVGSGGGGNLTSVQIFDVYRGEQLPEGKKSLAMRLEFRSPEGTLTDEEVNERRKAIVAELDKELGATLRE